MKVKTKNDYRVRRHLRLRQKVRGTAARPRMAVHVTNSHMYVQFIDDDAACTLAAAATTDGAWKDVRASVDVARKLGAQAAATAKEKGIAAVVFDRGGCRYAGKIKALAEAAREAGLTF